MEVVLFVLKAALVWGTIYQAEGHNMPLLSQRDINYLAQSHWGGGLRPL